MSFYSVLFLLRLYRQSHCPVLLRLPCICLHLRRNRSRHCSTHHRLSSTTTFFMDDHLISIWLIGFRSQPCFLHSKWYCLKNSQPEIASCPLVNVSVTVTKYQHTLQAQGWHWHHQSTCASVAPC